MPITIGSNIASLSALRQLNTATQKASSTSERLASGQRIVRASDDAAGLAIASNLNSRQRVLAQGVRNISDGQSFLAVAEGALHSLSDITIRIKELATQASNGAVSRTQRLALQSESDKLTEEFNRIVAATQFNGIAVLDGTTTSLKVQLGYGTSGSLDTSLTAGLARAQGTGSFGSAAGAGSTGVDTLVVDLNGDGKNDIVSTRSDLNGYYLDSHLGDGTGAIGAAATVSTPPGALSNLTLAAGDIDGDGDTDIVSMGTKNSNTTVTTYVNNGGSLSVSGKTTITSGTTSQLQLSDINNDGRADVLLFASTVAGGSAYTPGILVGYGQASGTIGAPSVIIGASASSSVLFETGDFTGDGKTDIVYANTLSGAISLATGSGGGSFSSSVVGSGDMLSSLASGDFNRDGLKDFAFTDQDPLLETHVANIALARGGSSFTFTESANGISATNVLDMNNDGYLDLVALSGLTVSTYNGRGDGTFGAVTSATLTHSPTSLGDLNGDGVPDAVSSQSSVQRWLQNTTNTTTAKYVTLATAESARESLAAIDNTLTRISTELGNIGAAQSRLQSAFQTVTAERENSGAAAGRIIDADVAHESANLIKNRILQNAAQAVLAQANQLPSLALMLLRP